SWNYHLDGQPRTRVPVTYDMARLQGLDSPLPLLVTLNRSEQIDPDKVLRRIAYRHPVFTPEAIAAQQRRTEISDRLRSWYCGACWGYGFHEDGVVSALAVLAELDRHQAVAA
ncbi:MAG: FAD-dependent oxidoreductase, partial [Gemmatimonadetes bacterium]|nr:FAD-dependent oxidoreductase [Gemmatimonadota bacterium]